MYYTGIDLHKKTSFFTTVDEKGSVGGIQWGHVTGVRHEARGMRREAKGIREEVRGKRREAG